MSAQNIVLVITATVTALMAGLFFAYSCSVNPGLRRLGDAEYLAAMQSINRAIQNPVFFAAFFGALVLLPVSAWISYSQPVTPRFWLLIVAALVYAAGVFGVTVAGNVPLNNALDAFQIKAALPEQIAAQRGAFEAPWNSLNAIRTGSSLLSVVLVIIACLIPARQPV